ncbi:MAG: ABC transporter permease [Nanoarchaeota archaeon]|nr:ABC transporter permease [Nanoarchaeota archaeon]MBU1631940.1 ABC transporter permease [Nanoarchaeota archaeon]MBU1875672.1 ABC transporter permease [Nanoarchaeota archaeon]
MKLLKIISKNIKVLLRSKSSAFVVLVGPLLIIALIALALSNAQEYKLTVGIVAPDNIGLTNQFINYLQTADYELIYYTSIEECVQQIKLKTTNLCIQFPANFILSNDKTYEVEFYADQSRMNLVESIVSSVSSTITIKSDEITLGLTKELLNTINFTKQEISKEKISIEKMKTKTSSADSNINKIDSDSAEVSANLKSTTENLESIKNSPNEISLSIASLETETNNLLEDLKDLIDELEDLEEIPSGLSKVKSHYTTLGTLLPTETADISNAANDLEDTIDSITAAVESASGNQIGTFANNVKYDINSIQEKITEIEASLQATKDKIDQIEITSASSIVNPFTIKVNPILSTSNRSTFMFPYFVTLIILFVGLMLSSSLIVMEKKSKAFFRTFTAPTSEFYHIAAVFMTNFFVIFLQLSVVFIGAFYYLKIPIINNFKVTLLILFLSLSFFILLGTLIGYIFKTQEGTTIASISIGSISLFLSNLILPIESFPGYVKEILLYNPFMLCSELFKKSMLFSSSFKDIGSGLIILSGYIILACILVTIFHEISLNKLFSVITNTKILRRSHFTEENSLRLRDGTLIKNKTGLLHTLKEMKDDEFKRFVNKRNNEIALWINDAFKERKLARSIKKAKTKNEIIKIINENLKTDKSEEKISKGFHFRKIRFKFVK